MGSMLLIVLAAALAQPPGVEHAPNAVVVAGALENGRLPLPALRLGAGGLGEPRAAAAGAGQLITPGGVLVRAQPAGVKLDFPSGAELLLMRDGVVHLRSGEHAVAGAATTELWLADGTRVRAVRSPRSRAPFAQVDVLCGDVATSLWLRDVALRRPTRPLPPGGACLLVLGDGDALYRAAALGPIVALERVLCPTSRSDDYPRRRIVVAGDVLIEGLRRLPEHVPPQPVQFPQAPEAARTLASLSGTLFPPGAVARPLGAAGELVLPLAGGFRLQIELRAADSVWLALHRGDVEVPVVEWSAGSRTTMHLLRPDGGAHGGPRYFLRGIEANVRARDLLPVPSGAAADRLALGVLRALGARPHAAIPVQASVAR